MSTPTNLLTIEVEGGYEILKSGTLDCENHEMSFGQVDKNPSEEVVVISGTLTVSP